MKVPKPEARTKREPSCPIVMACKMMGVSRDTCYGYKEAVKEDGFDTLLEKTRHTLNPMSRVEPHVEKGVIRHRC